MADVVQKIISGNSINNGGAVILAGSTIQQLDGQSIAIDAVETRLTDRFDDGTYYFEMIQAGVIPDTSGFDTGFDTGFD